MNGSLRLYLSLYTYIPAIYNDRRREVISCLAIFAEKDNFAKLYLVLSRPHRWHFLEEEKIVFWFFRPLQTNYAVPTECNNGRKFTKRKSIVVECLENFKYTRHRQRYIIAKGTAFQLSRTDWNFTTAGHTFYYYTAVGSTNI